MNNKRLDGNNAAQAVPQSLSLHEIKPRILNRLADYLCHLFPNGKTLGKSFLIGNLHGDSGKSLKVALCGERAGLWIDFATNERGDVVDLVAATLNLNARQDFKQVLQAMADWLGMPTQSNNVIAINTTLPALKASKESIPAMASLGLETARWDYHDGDGQLIAHVYRYDSAEGKQFRPWDVKRGRMQAPTPRPLYNQPALKTASHVLLVEGEKCAQALNEIGLVATTAMNGANAPLDKTDWSPLKGKHVTIWPDNDVPGAEYAANVAEKIISIGAMGVEILQPPLSAPQKWDAADAIFEQIDIQHFLDSAERRVVKAKGLQIQDWSALRFQGDAPAQQYLVEGIVPLGVVSILAAMGDTGKGMLTLKLAMEVAFEDGYQASVLGGQVRQHGTAVIFTAEDDQAEIHRRLQQLDPQNRRLSYAKKLLIIPLPNAGGPFPIVCSTSDGPTTTNVFREIVQQLYLIDDLRLVVFDPLSSFVHADVNADPAVSSFLTGLLARLASKTNAAVLVVHHMRKPPSLRTIENAEQARDAIRGSSALVDGVRMAYALWPLKESEAVRVASALNLSISPRALFQGAVVKANGPADRTIHTFCRNAVGLLEDVTAQLQHSITPYETLKTLLTQGIREAYDSGLPMTHTGVNGIFKQRHRLAQACQSLSRHKLEGLVQDLLNEKPPKIIKSALPGSREVKWLKVSGN